MHVLAHTKNGFEKGNSTVKCCLDGISTATLALALFLHPLESPFYTLPPCVRFSLAAFHTQRVGVCVCAWTQTTFDCEMF